MYERLHNTCAYLSVQYVHVHDCISKVIVPILSCAGMTRMAAKASDRRSPIDHLLYHSIAWKYSTRVSWEVTLGAAPISLPRREISP